MSVKVAIIAAVAVEPDQIMHGRTLLQKKLYFVSALTDENFGYGPYFYGPYSSIVSAELGALQAAAFIRETANSVGTADEFGELRRYDYQLGDQYGLFLTRHPEEAGRYRQALEQINDGRVSRDARLLSIAAKVHLILSDHGEATTDEIQEEAKALGWDIAPKDIEQVGEYLQRIEAAGTSVTR